MKEQKLVVVQTKFSANTQDITNYIRKRIRQAKDIEKLFKNLEKQGYTITRETRDSSILGVVTTVFVEGIFNGNSFKLSVEYTDNKSIGEYKQDILCICY